MKDYSQVLLERRQKFFEMFDDFESSKLDDSEFKSKYGLNDLQLRAMHLALQQRQSILRDLYIYFFEGI